VCLKKSKCRIKVLYLKDEIKWLNYPLEADHSLHSRLFIFFWNGGGMVQMLLIERKGKLKWNSANRKRYLDLGYTFTGWGEEFLVDIEHLTPTTRAVVYYKCDYCEEKIVETTYKNYVSKTKRSYNHKDSCEDCVVIKTIETNNVKYGGNSPTCSEEIRKKVKETTKKNYGVEYNTQNQLVREKVKETIMDRYGCENVFQLEDIKQKSIETNRKKYGVDYYNQTNEHKERIKSTNLEKYGVEYASQSPEFKEKVRETNIKRYGVPVPTQNKYIQAKSRITLFENNTAPTSFQQKYLHSLIGGMLNYPIGNISADIAFTDEKIIVEYDGGGHWLSVIHGNITMEEFNKKETKRQYYLLNQGWKIIRFISRKDLLPSDIEIVNLVNTCINYLNSGRHWIEIDIDNKFIKCSQYKKEITFNSLREVSKQKISNYN
jgi:very-short-patch-repair endonuclease